MVFMTSVPALSDGLEASMHLLVRYFVACVEQFNPLALALRLCGHGPPGAALTALLDSQLWT